MNQKRRSILVLLALVAALALAAPAALADKGGNTATTSSSISIASVNGTPMGALAPVASPKLGDTVTFATTVQKLAGNQWPMVAVTCYQGSTVVYVMLDTPGTVFKLGGDTSPWQQSGGSATCRADLDAYSFKNGQESVQLLATTGTWTASGS